jgi:hypothetical protein
VQDLGNAVPSILMFMLDTPCHWEIRWSKIDLSDGFWRMIVRAGQEANFVYELPPKPADPNRWFVLPSALQMGWTNSPAYFCETTDAVRCLAHRFLALAIHTGSLLPHELEYHCVGVDPDPQSIPWTPHCDFSILLRVFMDDFVKGVAGPPSRPTRRQDESLLTRATLHAIHALFPSPAVTGHSNGRDSISLKKLVAGDGQYDLVKPLLGFLCNGSPAHLRTVGLPQDKAAAYIDTIDTALAPTYHYMSRKSFEKLHGKLVHASAVLPCMGGFMSTLNTALASKTATIGLATDSPLRATLTDMRVLLGLAHSHPSHITELVGEALPHVYGYTDACQTGMGGVLLPCTRWLHPLVWRTPFPTDIQQRFDREELSINDLEMAANFVAERLLEHQLQGACEGLNSWLGSDNTTTVSWKRKRAPRASARSSFAPQVLRAEAILQRYTRRGPQDIGYIKGIDNLLGDFPSRSYNQGFPDNSAGGAAFLLEFSHRHPLPPQLGRWRLVPPTDGIICATFSMLRGENTIKPLTTIDTGGGGLHLPSALASTLCCTRPRDPVTTWNAHSCSWPLLNPCGLVTPTMANHFEERRSRGRYASAHSSWSPMDLMTLEDSIRATMH